MPKRPPKEIPQPEEHPERGKQPGRLRKQKNLEEFTEGKASPQQSRRRRGAVSLEQLEKSMKEAGMGPTEPWVEDKEALIPTAESIYDFVALDRGGPRASELLDRVTLKKIPKRFSTEERAKLLTSLGQGFRGERPAYVVTKIDIPVKKYQRRPHVQEPRDDVYMIRFAQRLVPEGRERITLVHLEPGGEGYAVFTTRKGFENLLIKGLTKAVQEGKPPRRSRK